MPKKTASETPNRNFRIEDALYNAAVKKARSEGRSLSEVVRALLYGWVSQTAGRAAVISTNHVAGQPAPDEAQPAHAATGTQWDETSSTARKSST